MKSFLSKHKWKLLLAFIIFIVAIPLGINSLFKLTSPLDIFVAEWEAGDALAFYGVMLASATTIIGVYISIEYAQRNYRVDEANRVKPYLALTHYKSHSKINLLSGLNLGQLNGNVDEQSQDTFAYKEYRLEKVYIIIGQSAIEFKDKPNRSACNLVGLSGAIKVVGVTPSKRTLLFLCPSKSKMSGMVRQLIR